MISRSRLLYSLFTLLIFCSSIAKPAVAANATARRFAQVEISPDGNRVAWIGPSATASASSATADGLYIQNLDRSSSDPIRVGELAASDVADITWSRDSRKLAFLCTSGGQAQVCIADSAGQLKKVSELKGDLADPAWSPDGKLLAFLFTENAPRKAGPLEAMTPELGVIESKIYEQRLAVVDIATGKVEQLSPADMYVYEFDWSPDGRQLAVIAAPGEGDANWYVAQLYRLAVGGGALTPVHKPLLQIAIPRWAPDGQSIAFIGGLMSDESSVGGDIFVVPAEGGEARNVTPGIAASPSWLSWTSPEKIMFAERIEGDTGIGSVDVKAGKIAQIWRGEETITSFGVMSASADGGQTAVVRQSASRPPEIWAGKTGEWRQITRVNAYLHPDWGEMKSLRWTSDGLAVQGWLMYPANYDSHQRYPMVVMAHGGPALASGSTWPANFFSSAALSKAGYFVLLPNPRGSYGMGEAFTRANVKDFGYGDLRDILAGVDMVVKTLPVDNDRIGITGWSYGGFMTMWAVTQTNRFRAAVSGAGLSNWQSYYGENDIDQWMIPYFGASVYDDPAVYAKSSAINFVKNVKTPTLMVVGERDGEVPAPQSREFWHALKALGVPTQLVIYAGEGHMIQNAEHQKDIMERLIGWFDRYLK